jgi:hypothetical protein
MQEALNKASEAMREIGSDLITTTLSQVGKRFSETPRALAEIEEFPMLWPTCSAPTLEVSTMAETGVLGFE